MTVIRRYFRILYVCFALSILVDMLFHFLYHPRGEFLWEKIPAFYALFGFIGCIILIVVSKALGHYWLQKEEDYYERR
ncbi:MAG: hypothetical protein ACXQTS_00940 [Candidatus Methanospirareceae archaeon]